MKQPIEEHIQTIEQQGQVNNPFPGLRHFKIDESHLFFGREGQSDEVLLKLSQHRFVGVIGPSGSGKSSFIYCGVLPILYGGFLTDASASWEVIVTRPGAGPIDNLGEALLKSDPEYQIADEEEKAIRRKISSTLLRSSSQGLVEAILQFKKDKGKNYLILVDQFEELFRFKDQADNQNVNETLAFVNLLMSAVNYEEVPIYVAITMRSDFIGDCAQFPELTRKLNDSHYLIPQMTREQKRRAITGPVAVGGAEISGRLVQQLLNDLGDNPDQLPILQHALMRTWDYWSHFRDVKEEPVDIKHYEAIGTMEEALSMHANEAYDELNEDQKRICEMVFKAITEKRGENFGIRRPTRLSEIAAIANVKEAEVIEVIEKFREPGRSLLTPQFGVPLDGKSIIDISHESLMRIWDRLKNWVNDEADAVQMYLRLAEAAAMYQQGKTSLWRPPDLHLALNWREKHQPTLVWGQRYHPAYERTMEFLNYSEKEYELEQKAKERQQKRALRRARITVLILASATIVSIGFLIFAFYQQTQITKQKERADNQAAEAKKAAAIATKEKEQAQKARAAALLQKQKADSARNEADAQREQAMAAKSLAEQRRQQAVTAEGRANDEAEKARKAEGVAKENMVAAVKAKSRADQLRYLAIANAMAVKSVQLSNPTLKGLLAQQAYNFDLNYGSYAYDPEIYQGLYYALKSLGHPVGKPLKGHQKAVRAMVNGERGQIFSASTDGSILEWTHSGFLWKADTLEKPRMGFIVKAMLFDKSQHQLVVAGDFPENVEGTSFMQTYSAGGQTSQIGGVSGSVVKVLNQEADHQLYVLDEGGREIRTGKQTLSAWMHPGEKLTDLIWGQNQAYLLAATESGKLIKISLQDKSETTLYEHSVAISALAQHGETVVLGDINGGVKVFENGDFENALDLVGHLSQINKIVFNHAGTFFATASKDRTVRLWNMGDLKEQPINMDDQAGWVWSLAFTDKDDFVLSGVQNGNMHAWPTKPEMMDNEICPRLKRNMTQEEWNIYVADDIPYQPTCEIKKADQ